MAFVRVTRWLNGNAGGACKSGLCNACRETFFAGDFRLEIVLDAMGEVLGLCLEVRGIAGRVGSSICVPSKFGAQAQAFVNKGLVDL
jgi:hypothetical protein